MGSFPRPRAPRVSGRRGTVIGVILAGALAAFGADLAFTSTMPALGPAADGAAFVAGQPQDESFVETFDEAWRIIAETHYDPEFGGLDWDAVRDELRPRAEQATTVFELRLLINDMIARLGLSHFALWPREALGAFGPEGEEDVDREASGGSGLPGFETMMVGDAFVVSAVDAGGSAGSAGVRTGWVVSRIGEIDVAERLELMTEHVEGFKARVEAQRAMARLLSGPPGSDVEIGFLDGADAARTVTVGRRRPQGSMSRFGNLPPLLAELDYEIVEPDLDITVGVIRFNIWLPVLAPQFDVALDSMRHADGVVLDLRGNPGGLGGMVMGIGGHFVDENVSLGTMRMRDTELQFMTNPRRVSPNGEPVEPFAGPLAILMDNTSASTSEVFAGGMQAIGRARIFGQRSMGAVLPSLMDRLPNGDILQHAVADFIVTATGERLEGRGVVPDEEIEVIRADLLAGRDPALEAALTWIVRQR